MNRRIIPLLFTLPLFGCPPTILSSPENTPDACADGFDNDLDGSADCSDIECIEFPSCDRTEVCTGGLDEDGDLLIDCDDPGCSNALNCFESSCTDGVDNDNNGATDCGDVECSGDPSCTELNCANNADDDQDGDVDCDDDDCFGEAACIESSCADGADNDTDGDIDCDDADCANDIVCQSTCGDSVVEGAEACDDGNITSGDGCDSLCRQEPGFEVEVNNDLATSNDFTLVSIADVVKGRINPAQDRDMFRVTIPAGALGNITAQTLDSFSGVTCLSNNIDSEITIFNASQTSLANDDDSGDGFCSLASASAAPPGDYFIEVRATDANTNLLFDYNLRIQVALIVCGDGSLGVGEQCDDGNTANDDGCSSSCQIENVGFDCPSGQSLVQISANNVNLAIPDNNATGVTNSINVSNNGVVRRVMVHVDSLTHSFDGDVDILFRSPNNTEIELSTDNGGLLDNYTNTLFDDNCGVAGDGLITSGVAPFTGCFRPEGSLATYIGGNANGSWTLVLRDDALNDLGTLNSWTLGLCVQ